MRSLISVSATALVLAAVLATASRLAGGKSECGATPPEQEAVKLAPCIAAGKDLESKPSDRCCAAVKEIGERSPECLCAVLLSKIVRRVGVKPEVAITIPKRCDLTDRPIGYKCGSFRFVGISTSAQARVDLSRPWHTTPSNIVPPGVPGSYLVLYPRPHPLLRRSSPCILCWFHSIQSSVPCSIHGRTSSPPPCQPRRAHGHGQIPPPQPPVAAAQEAAPARLPRRPASPAAAPAALRRAGNQGGGRQDGRGDHREVRPRGRPLENIQLEGGGGRRGRGGGEDEEVENGPGQGAPGQVRRRVPGHLDHAVAHLLHRLLPPHQRRRRRPAAARQDWDRHGRDRGQGGDVRAGLRRAQGRVADKVPADCGAHAGRGQLDREDHQGRRLTHVVNLFCFSLASREA